MEARVEALEKELKELKMGKQPAKKEKNTRPPSKYNNYMKEALAKIKNSHPELSHKDRFKLAASGYKETKKSSE